MGLFGLTAGELFLRILSLEAGALPVLGAVLLARWLLGRASRRAVCLLWLVFWLRLLVPFTIQVPWGLPAAEAPVTAESVAVERSDAPDASDGGMNTPVELNPAPAAGEAANHPAGSVVPPARDGVWLPVCAWIWEAGVAGMLLYSAVSLIRLRRRLAGAVRLEGNVYLADRAGSPFVLGLPLPRIYLPSDLPEGDRDLILRHERAHIRGRHHLWKPLAFLALAVHWFNPLVWLAFCLFVSDLEAACDEAAAAGLDRDGRADYAAALLRLSAPRRAVLEAPLAFGEGDPKRRIRRVLDFRRPRTWAAVAATVLAVLLFGFMLTSRSVEDYPLGAAYRVSEAAYQSGDNAWAAGYFVTGDYRLWACDGQSSPVTYLGDLEPYDLTRRELLGYCAGDASWLGGKPGRVTRAWWLRLSAGTGPDGLHVYPVEGEPPAVSREDALDSGVFGNFYLLFRTADGDTWLAYGWEDLSERSPHGGDPSDDTSVYWLAKLERDTEVGLGRYCGLDEALALDSGISATMRGTLECGEKTAAYVNYWYSPEGGPGLAVYRGGSRGGLLAQDRSEFLERTGLYACSMDDLTEVAPGSGVYTLPLGFPLEYDGQTEMRTPVLCLNGDILDIERIAAEADGTELARDRDRVVGRGMAFFPSLPDTVGREVTVTYRFYDEQGNEIFYDGEGREQEGPADLGAAETAESAAPTEAQVLALRERVEAGMTEEEIARLRDVIFVANNWFEHKYFYNRLFEHLSDPEDLYWNYFEQTGEIQIGWAVSGSIDMAAVCEQEGLTEKEFYEKYGKGVRDTNEHTLDDFIAVLEELKESVQSGLLNGDFDRMQDLCAQAKETRDDLCVNELFQMLHDMEYFLLRYGLTDVGPYVTDTSWLATYFGSLSVWEGAGPAS